MPFFYAFSIRQSVVRLMPRLCAARLWLSPLFSNTIRTISRSMRASGWERSREAAGEAAVSASAGARESSAYRAA